MVPGWNENFFRRFQCPAVVKLSSEVAQIRWSLLRASSGFSAFECLDATRGGLRRRGRIEEDVQAPSMDRSWRCRWVASWIGLGVKSCSKRRRLSWPASPSTSPRGRDLPSTISPGEDTFVTTMRCDHWWPKEQSSLFSVHRTGSKCSRHGGHLDA